MLYYFYIDKMRDARALIAGLRLCMKGMLLRMEFVTIGGVKIERTCALSPMASVADRAYRLICKSFGASLLTSEMISAKGLCYNSRKTGEMCLIDDSERPYAIQLFGEEPEFMAKAVKIIRAYKPDIIDINMGCPVPKVVNPGGGSALMKTPDLAADLVKAACDEADCPVTVKIRAGWDEGSCNAVEFAVRMEEAGAAAIAVHPRTRRQMYSGFADWSVIAGVKAAANVPVIGNGDIHSAFDCERMYKETGCDLCSLARGSYGRPWIFKEIRDYLEGGTLPTEPSFEERMEIMLRHVRLLISLKGEDVGIREARKNVAWYFKGQKNGAAYRCAAGNLRSLGELEDMVKRAIIDLG